jgi:hypothetical protein
MYDTTGTPSGMEESPSIAREENAPASPSKYPERLVDDSRTSVKSRGVWVDNTSAVNEELMAVIPNKIFKMRTVFELVKDLNFEGQVGFICLEMNERKEPVSCVAVTALHNIAEIKDNPITATYVRSTVLCPSYNRGFHFPKLASNVSTSLHLNSVHLKNRLSRGNMGLTLPGVAE